MGGSTCRPPNSSCSPRSSRSWPPLQIRPKKTNISVREIGRVSQLVSQLTGYAVQRNKAIVGASAFAHEAGIHQDGMLKDASTYQIMDPQELGLTMTLPLRTG